MDLQVSYRPELAAASEAEGPAVNCASRELLCDLCVLFGENNWQLGTNNAELLLLLELHHRRTRSAFVLRRLRHTRYLRMQPQILA